MREECKIDLEFRMVPLENHVQVAQYEIEQIAVCKTVYSSFEQDPPLEAEREGLGWAQAYAGCLIWNGMRTRGNPV
jgi:hypothetical protein